MQAMAYQSVAPFLTAAGEWLEREESLNNMILGLAGRLAMADKPPDPPAAVMTVSGPTQLEVAAIAVPPRGVVLYAPGIGTIRQDQAITALEVLADALRAGGHTVPECLGPSAAALAFAQIWTKRTGGEFTLMMAQRIYEARGIAFPIGVSGVARLPRPEDIDLLADWTHRYGLEISGGRPGDPDAARASVQELVAAGRKLIWEDQGQPVSMAAAQRPLRHGIAISRVYTPPEHRCRGYASACVAALSQRQFHSGKQFCCLYTDLANPTSNSIYQKIGYKPVGDSSHYRFEGRSV